MQVLKKKFLKNKKGILGMALAASLVLTGSFTTNAAYLILPDAVKTKVLLPDQFKI